MDKIFENTIEKRAKNYANEQCRCYKCDGIDNFTHNNCKLSLDEGCQEHRWKEMGYKQGAKDQREIDIKKLCDYMCELSEETLIEEFHTIKNKCFDEGIEGWQREKLIARHFYKLGLNARKEE